MLVYVKYKCFVMHMWYVCVLCASCCSSQCCVLHDLEFVKLIEDAIGHSTRTSQGVVYLSGFQSDVRRSNLWGPRNIAWTPSKSKFVHVRYSIFQKNVYFIYDPTVYYIHSLCDIECSMLNIRLE